MTRGVLTAAQSQWVRWHRERFDRARCPDGLVGEAIPVEARILAVADAWDRLRKHRPRAAALDEVQAAAGARFCPTVIVALARLHRAGALAH
jgi:HD-GYP domain-containing protein (c-di-GMP phosphodiesterase class II)